MMRIIAGTHARTHLIPPSDRQTRPISDRVKEALFSILQFRIAGAHVADLFCGTGSMGLESLSRGAEHVLMVEINTDAINRLRQNVEKCGFTESTTIIQGDLFHPEILANRLGRYDLLFVDPPYRLARESEPESKLGQLLLTIENHIKDQALVIVRHEKKTTLLENYKRLTLTDRREYGGMALTFLEKTNDAPDA
jgi:16S rRNA (guanine966-N2)-methyltransferase